MTVVRLGTAADLDPAMAVFADASAARRGIPVGPEKEASVRRRIEDGGWLVVAEEGAAVVGMAVGFDARADDGAGPLIPGRCHLGLVYVDSGRWGEGIAGAVVDAVLDEARRRGYDAIQLWTHESNVRARRLYAGRGFTAAGRTKLDDSGEPIDFWERAL